MRSDELEEETGTQEKTARKITFRTQEANGQETREPRLDTVEKGLTRLENAFKTKAWKDNLMTAKLREDLDFMMNVKNEDRIVLTGLTSTTPPPINQDEKNLWIREIAKEFIKTVYLRQTRPLKRQRHSNGGSKIRDERDCVEGQKDVRLEEKGWPGFRTSLHGQLRHLSHQS